MPYRLYRIITQSVTRYPLTTLVAGGVLLMITAMSALAVLTANSDATGAKLPGAEGRRSTVIPAAGYPKLCGINLSGAEFGDQALPGRRNVDYHYATDSALYRTFRDQSQQLVRIPFRWERLQPRAFGPLAEKDLAELQQMVAAALAADQQVILDLHNYGRYYNQPLTVATADQLADFWRRLAPIFTGQPGIFGYELMNEPHDLPEGGDGWAQIVQQTVTAIRQVDTETILLIPGYDRQHPQNWAEVNRNLVIVDPSNRLLYAAHHYFDADHSGRYAQPNTDIATTTTRIVEELQPYLNWLEQHQAQGILTEVGVPNQPDWLRVYQNYLQHLSRQPVVIGVVLWSAGPWWGEYPLRLDPASPGSVAPQIQLLQPWCGLELAPS